VNLVLLTPDEMREGVAALEGRRARHVQEVHRATPGDTLVAGILGGSIGRAVVRAVEVGRVVLEFAPERPPPAPPGIDLMLALPRPKILKRVLAGAASMGVKRIVLVNAARVEKSYFDSPQLRPETMREHLVLGLEQARDTVLPEILIRPRFRPFVEGELDAVWPGAHRLLADPAGTRTIAQCDCGSPPERAVLAVGPEGGWVPFERELLVAHGFQLFSAGERILRVDVAVPFLFAQLAMARASADRAP